MQAAGFTIRYLTPENSTFERTPGRMLSLKTGEDEYAAVHLHCSFPHSDPRTYISVRSSENKEIGIIRSLDDFPKGTLELLEDQIHIRYFSPKINKVIRIKEEFGYTYWETETNAGNCRFTVRNGGGNVKWVSDIKILITDVDGNRFVVEDAGGISEKEFAMIEMCM